MDRGAPTPSWVEEEPATMVGDDFFLRSFWDLSTERQIGFTVGPIPVLAIHQYACAVGVPSHMMGFFEALVRGLDKVYLQHAEETRKKAAKRATPDNRTRQTKPKT